MKITKHILAKIILIICILNLSTFNAISSQKAGANIPYIAGAKITKLEKKQSRTSILNQKTLSSDLNFKCQKFVQSCIDETCFKRQTKRQYEPYMGVADKCKRYSQNQFVQKIRNCLPRFKSFQYDFSEICDPYIMHGINNFRENANETNVRYASTTQKCVYSKKELFAAKNCYTIMIGSNGDYNPRLKEAIDQSCGFQVDGGSGIMSSRFFNAGILEMSEQRESPEPTIIPKLVRGENWREVVEAILGSYINITKSECGEEDFSITKINIYNKK